MEDLNNVPSTGTFGNSINQVNQNFGLVKGAIENVEGRTIRSKGLFPTQASLTAAYPSPKVGDYAYVGSSLPATVYDCLVEGTWHNTGQTGGSETIDLSAYSTTAQMNTAIDNGLQGQVGYSECNTEGSTQRKDVVVNGFKLLASGGALHIKMTEANTHANATMNISPTSTIVAANTKPLFYNGAQASAENTWGANEIISVYYDGINYQATNSQGGGGKAVKTKYDSQGGLGADNVQDALDEVTSLIPRDVSCTWVQGGINTADGTDSVTQARIRSEYIAVKDGDIIHVNPKTHYVGIYLYNTDKTTALGAYAVTLTTGEYEYICPQDGFVRLTESKVTDTSENIEDYEQIAEINIDTPLIVTQKDLDAAINDLLSTEVDISALSIQVGYPSATGVWLTATLNSGVYRYHKLITRTAEMKKIKVDAPQGHAARYCFITDYTVPVRNSITTREPTTPTPCNFCEDPAVVHNVGAGSSSGWVDIPDNCAYIVLVVQNGSAQYEASSVYICKDNTNYDTSGMRVLDNSAFVQGNFGADGKTTDSNNQRLRANAYYKVNEGDRIILDYQEQKFQVWKYDNNKDYLGNTGWYTERIFECENDGYLRFTAATARSNNTITTLYGKVYIPTEEGEESEDWKDEYTDKVADVARPPRVNRYPKSKMLTLLHFSDLHIDRIDEMQRIMDFYNANSSKIDDILNTGDLQDADFGSGIANFLAVNGHERVLNVIGNHDVYKSGIYNGSGNEVNVYNRFIKDFVSSWGVVQPTDAATNGLNYWYKDYTDTTSYTTSSTRPAVPRSIRLIALDCMYWTTAQNTWLQDVLSSTPNTMSVIVACHYKPSYTRIECNMDDGMQESIDYGIDPNADPGYVNAAAVTSVKNFIDGGGKFICWLCGHDHKDFMGLATADSRQ